MNNVEKTVAFLMEQGKRISFAESCTGGLLAATQVDVPDASKVLDMSFVTYANEAKIDLVDVSPETLSAYGAVSEQTAREMASGVARRSGAQIGVSATGIAGPGGGTPEKPVGTVCFGLSDAAGTVTETVQFGYKSDRSKIRRLTTARAMMNVIRRLEGNL